MKLKVLASGSAGNSYILETETEALVIEAGVPFKKVLRNVDHKKINGVLVSHEHKDHSKYIEEYKRYGKRYISNEQLSKKAEWFGGFRVRAFEVFHNVPCHGYLIEHSEMGKLVSATDTGYIEYKFQDISHWLIECNYSKNILDQRVKEGFNTHLADRIVKDHMSLETCKLFFSRNDLKVARNIVLLHLSDGNSHAAQFQKEIQELTNKSTYIADEGLEIDISLVPF